MAKRGTSSVASLLGLLLIGAMIWKGCASCVTCIGGKYAQEPKIVTRDDFLPGSANTTTTTLCSRAEPRGEPSVVVTDETGPSSVAVDGSGIYWTNSDENSGIGAVVRLRNGNDKWEVLAKAQYYPDSIIIDDKHVYWKTGRARIMRVPKNGGAPMVFATGRGSVDGLASDGDAIYWSQGVPFETYEVMKAPKKGGVPRVLAKGQEEVFGRLALSAQRVFWKNKSELRSVPKAGGQVASHGDVLGFGADGVDAYWAIRGRLSRQSDAGTLTQVTPNVVQMTDLIVADAEYVYGFYNGNFAKGSIPEANLWRVVRGGGCPSLLVTLHNKHINEFVVYNSAVFWADHRSGSIWSVPR